MAIISSLSNTSYLEFAIGVTFAALLAMGVFHHASTRGNRRATAWGIATFLAAVIVVPLYFVNYWLSKRDHR